MSTHPAGTADAPAAAPIPSRRKAEGLAIKPENVTINGADHVWRTVLVRMSEGMTGSDLANPAIWRRVQASPQKSLMKLDHLLILAADESWYRRAIVTDADNQNATLALEELQPFRAPESGLYSDGHFEVHWTGVNYVVRGCVDRQPVTNGFSTEGQAIDALRRIYAGSM